ncbi:MAG: hypothetical protein ACRD5K_14525 [Candidatus Acidiferrales bacterium]
MNWFRKQYEDIKGNFKWAVLGLIGTGVAWLVHHLVSLLRAPNFVTWLVVLIFLCAMFYWVARGGWTPQTSQQSKGLLPPNPASIKAFDDLEAFFQTYQTPLMAETEMNIRARAEKYKPGPDRERFLVTTCARFVLLSANEQIWSLIFRSQIRALEEVNKHPVKIDLLKHYYDAGLREDPKVYGDGKYSFVGWLAFLRRWILVVENGDSLEISGRGREFLKYLVHTGRSANERRG